MKVKVIWSLIVLQEIILNVTIFAVDENPLSQSAYFTTQQNKKLMGHVVQRFESPSLMSRGHSCIRNTWCSSTNFEQLTWRGDKGTCELNKHDISTVNEDTNFQDRQGSTFTLHLKGCLMTGCLNGGSCSFDDKKDTFSCSCKLPWIGEDCGVKTEPAFHFTTLNASGKEGPTSNAGYKGSSLENLSVTNGLQEWSAPLTGYYHVDMCGASGGLSYGGKGARVNGTVHLQEGTKLIVLVGQRGAENASLFKTGGGGGSFVVFSSNLTPLSIAEGGGGGQLFEEGGPGQAGEVEGLMLGSVRQGGRLICVESCNWRDLVGGYSGGGFCGDGECFNHSFIMGCNATAAKSFLNGGRGGSQDYRDCCDGGFGGEGASFRYILGGGGGYSGGSVSGKHNNDRYNFKSGGGGSFVPSKTWNAETRACDKGDGYVTFRFLGYDKP